MLPLLLPPNKWRRKRRCFVSSFREHSSHIYFQPHEPYVHEIRTFSFWREQKLCKSSREWMTEWMKYSSPPQSPVKLCDGCGVSYHSFGSSTCRHNVRGSIILTYKVQNVENTALWWLLITHFLNLCTFLPALGSSWWNGSYSSYLTH